jgi:glycosyltransferase involved in cell wall biosynthesis
MNNFYEEPPLITVVVPSFNQGKFLEDALRSIFDQCLPVEVFVMDGGSTDGSLDIIRRWENRLAGWRSGKDGGQAAAINAGVKLGKAPFVAWLNSDDVYLIDGLKGLLTQLESSPYAPAVYGRVWNTDQFLRKINAINTERFSRKRLATRCIISQPGTLIRRSAWELVGGTDPALNMAMDYDLWWRISESCGEFLYFDGYVAINRDHEETKTNTKRSQHYRESMVLVKKYYGRIPVRWFIAWPISVFLRTLKYRIKKYFSSLKKGDAIRQWNNSP